MSHRYFDCEKCGKKVKEGSRALHLLRCSKDKKTVCCNICGDNLEFELIFHHLKIEHNCWDYRRMEEAEPEGEAVPEGEALPAAPPSTPEVLDELVRLVAELEKIDTVTEQVKKQAEQNIEQQPLPVDLNTIDKENLVKLDNFDFNLLLFNM